MNMEYLMKMDEIVIWKFSDHKKVFSFFPRKCRISGESLWFKKAYRCRVDDWGSWADEWYSVQAYVWEKLKYS